MTSNGDFVEVQGSGEESTFTPDQLNAMIELGQEGIRQLLDLQQDALA
jgi:ribonuclease PH